MRTNIITNSFNLSCDIVDLIFVIFNFEKVLLEEATDIGIVQKKKIKSETRGRKGFQK